MEQVLKNTASFLKVLEMSRTSSLQEWSSEALQRAFQWANYFGKVHTKLKSKPTYVEKISNELEKHCTDGRLSHGCCVLKFNDLENGKEILAQNIMQNVWCTPEIYLETIKNFYKSQNIDSKTCLLSSDLKCLNKSQQISKTIKLVGTKILKTKIEKTRKHTIASSTKDLETSPKRSKHDINHTLKNDDRDLSDTFAFKVRARLLKDVLTTSLRSKDNKENLKKKLEDITSGEAGSALFLEAILHLNNKDDGKFQSFVIQYLKDHMFPKWKVNPGSFLSLPTSLVFEVVHRMPDILNEYVETLYASSDFYDGHYGIEEHYSVLSVRGKLSQSSTKRDEMIYILKEHFFELKKWKELDMNLLLKMKSGIDKLHGTENNFLRSDSTWNRLWKL